MAEQEFPIPIGGADTLIGLPGRRDDAAAAWLGQSEGDLFVQPADGVELTCNGARVATSRWLRSGDVVAVSGTRLRIEFDADGPRLFVEHTTEPRPPTHPGKPAPSGRDSPASAPVIRPLAFEPRRPLGVTPPRRPVAWRGAAAKVSVALLLAVAWYVFTARSVRLEIEPPPEHVALSGGLLRPLVGGRYLLRSGPYRLRAGRVGYGDLDVTLDVDGTPHQIHRFVLERLPGRLHVRSLELEQAEVSVDGAVRGTTPLPPFELTAGEHGVRVSAEGYLDFEASVAIAGGGELQALDVRLVANHAAVTFASDPSGASVRVESRELGRTPFTSNVGAGSRDVRFALGGYKPADRRIEVVAGQPLAVPVVRLLPADGRVALTSQPPGAAVSVDGAYVGETPLDLAIAPGKEHDIRVSKAGYEGGAVALRVAADESRSAHVQLREQIGEVRVEARPPDAELFVDGESRGRVGQTLALRAVPHDIEIRREGYETHRTQVTPRPGVPQLVNVVLDSPDQRATQLAESVEGPNGHVLRLVRAGRIQMGAPRREAGRRANETEHEVELTRAYYMGSTEVTNGQYRAFKREHLSGRAEGVSLDFDHHPVVRLSWDEAAGYCNWLSEQASLPPAYAAGTAGLEAVTPLTAGYRLPTEAEWAWAARGGDGTTLLKYSWGDSLPVPPQAGNLADRSAASMLSRVLPDYDDGYAGTAPADAFGPSPRGLFGMGGNVAEWVHDFYGVAPPVVASQRDPSGPADGQYHVIRGASYMHSSITELRLSYRDYGKAARPDVGFRVARYAE